MSGIEDASLLAAIAERRDEQAFETLYARHSNVLFGIARRITGCDDMAEEALQDGMLRIWTSAGQYRGQGSVRQWMAAIVAGKSLDVLREKRRLAVEGNFERMENLSREGEEEEKAGGEIERGEIAMALRDAIERLSDESQRLLALHYGAGMTHEQISEALGMPRRTVSWKLERSLDRLRGMLERAGFAAAAPIIGGEGMAEAIFSGYEAPSAVRDRLLSKLARPSARSARPYRNGRFAAGAKKHRSPHGWRFRPSLFR